MSDPQSLVDFQLPTVLKDFQDLARDFAKQVIRPAEVELDKMSDPSEIFASQTFKDVMKKMYEIGFHKIGLPEAVGGDGIGTLGQMVVLEEIAVGGAGLASQLLLAPLGAHMVAAFDMGQRSPIFKDYLEAFVSDTEGKHSGAWGITEPNAGSDTLIETPTSKFATQILKNKDKKGYVVNGSKSAFISNGGLADMIFLCAGLDPDKGIQDGSGAALVPGNLPGLTRGKPTNKLGLRALNQAEIFFDNVEIPDEFMVIPTGPEYRNILEGFVTNGNPHVGTLALGVARAAYEEALAYAKTRRQGGKLIFEHQLIAMKLFKAFRSIEAARAFLWKAHFTGEYKIGAAARAVACDMAIEVTCDMVQVLGGYGISKEYPVEKFYRDAKLTQIMDGTVDVMSLRAAARL